MSLFGFDPESVFGRIQADPSSVRELSLSQSMAAGSLGFAAVSLAAYGVWAWGGRWLGSNLGELGLYTACAAVLIGGGGLVFRPLVIGPAQRGRFFSLFALAFFLYAGVWTGSYFSLRGRSGEWLGALLGPAILGMTFANAFSATGVVHRVVALLFVSHALGYFLGGFLHERVSGVPGILLWGGAYGVGFGAGIGGTLHACQAGIRKRLAASSS